MIAAQPSLSAVARVSFATAFGRAPEVVASAPGRVNLLGEHTDYNDGFVLPTALPRTTVCALAKRSDQRVCVRSEAVGELGEIELGRETPLGTWLDYIQGVTRAAREHGYALHGFDAWLGTDLPLGGGLSSSAALSVALLRALREAFGWSLGAIDLARLAQWSENHVVGAPVGILDPLACELGQLGSALFIDTQSLSYESLSLPKDAQLVVLDSGVRHSHASGDYRKRRLECETAARLLGVSSLRELQTAPEIASASARLLDPLDRRVRHVLSENERVLRAVQALKDDDAVVLGALFNASHASMRDDFEVSVPAVDRIVDAAIQLPSVWGARLTGGGFGGSVICLARRGEGERVARTLAPITTAAIVVDRELAGA